MKSYLWQILKVRNHSCKLNANVKVYGLACTFLGEPDYSSEYSAVSPLSSSIKKTVGHLSVPSTRFIDRHKL